MDTIEAQGESDESTPIPAGMRYEHGEGGAASDRGGTDSSRKGSTRRGAAVEPRRLQARQRAGPTRWHCSRAKQSTRVPELVPIRYGRMLVSPFTFYRGAALIMASDLAHTPRSGLTTQLCGDAHLMNFGVFGSPDRRLVFDMNDFDETLPGPWEWDVKRLAASFAIAGRDNGYPVKERKKVVLSVVGGYRSAMRQFAAMTNLDVWYSRFDADALLERDEGRISTGGASSEARRHGQGPHARQHASPRQAHPHRGRRATHHQRPAPHPARRGARGRDARRADHRLAPGRGAEIPQHAAVRSSSLAGGLPSGPRRSQGGRGRQRRYPSVDPPDVGPRRRRSAVPPGQGSPALGARGLRRAEPTRLQRRARRPRPAPHGRGERHLLGLAHCRRYSTA